MKKIILLIAFVLLFTASYVSAACTVARGNGDVWKITGTTASAQVILPGTSTAKIHSIYWFAPTSSGHLLDITDAAGNCIGADFRCVVPYQGQILYFDGLKVKGLAVQDMDSGEVQIKFE